MVAATEQKQVHFEDVEVGQEIPSITLTPSTQQLVHWAAASGDFYQIHYDTEFAKSTGLQGIIVHGALKHALLGRMLWEWVRYDGKIKRYGVSYRGMDVPGQAMTLKGTVTGKRTEGGENLVDLEIWTENPQGQKTTPGTATVVLPSRT
ncbi:MAG TPA: MaoC/PaaZ C-terminal domain-containing protein [Vicinamibacterales bacterium]|nr:MaoC/PaaZ C-terminal domain-containing protein [Vicinamibacterales bacterium]